MLLLTVSSKTSRKPIKTLDICDSCYKEWTNVRINVEKKKLTATLKNVRRNAWKIGAELFTKAHTKNFEEKTILTAPYEQT